jgi:glucosamine--fructose-6-phosphate aminotransferase (isomerizing)
MKSLGKFPDPFIAEISGQPDALRRAAEGLTEQRDALAAIADSSRDRTVVFTGMGSSYDACYPAVVQLARAGITALMLDAAELLHFRMDTLGPRTLLVAVSQSGESAEVVRVAEGCRARAQPPAMVSVTNGVDNTLEALADTGIDTRAGEETGPSTMTFAGSLVAVGAIGRVLAGGPVPGVADDLSNAAERAAIAIERLLADTALPDRLASWLGDRSTVVILGRGPARAAAEMGALTIKEAVGIPVESLQTAQFRHGPLELAGPGLAAIIVATEPETHALDLGLARELADEGAAVLLVTEEPTESPGGNGGPEAILEINTGALDRAIAPAVSVLPAQLLAWRLATIRGREPGAYYRASKVTTRE